MARLEPARQLDVKWDTTWLMKQNLMEISSAIDQVLARPQSLAQSTVRR